MSVAGQTGSLDFRPAALRVALVGVVALAAAALGLPFLPAQFFQSYLVAYLFWLALSLGSLVLLMIHNLTGGAWGIPLQRSLEAASGATVLLAVLFVPLLAGLPLLYAWADPEVVRGDDLLQKKELYLNVPFFVVRAALYFTVWILLSWLTVRGRRRLEQGGDIAAVEGRLRGLSAPGLLLYGLTITFAAIDWVMSLEPHWYSSLFGVLIASGQLVPAFGFAILAGRLLALPEGEAVRGRHGGPWSDIGGLLLAFVMLWAYMSFSQYFLIWAGNLPEENVWYLRRSRGGWEWLAGALLVFYFVVPFLVLLSGDVKGDPGRLAPVAALLLVAHYVNQYWLVAPAFGGHGHGEEAVAATHFTIHWLDPLLLVGLGGLWLGWFLWRLPLQPLLHAAHPEDAHHA